MTATVTAMGIPVATPAVKWSTSDERIATIDASGTLTPRKPGTTYVVGRIGALADSTPVSVSMRWIDLVLSMGLYSTCGIGGDSTAYCWGEIPGAASPPNPQSRPAEVPGGLRFGSISMGVRYACAITGAGRVYCWGNNDSGQLGDGTTTKSTSPVAVATNVAFTRVSAGFESACGLSVSGEVYCWGANGYGQRGGTVSVSTPTRVAGLPRVTQLSSGAFHVCALTFDGAAYCWGANFWGNAGRGTINQTVTAGPVTGNLVFRDLSSGFDGACAIAVAGGLYCWGSRYASSETSGLPLLFPQSQSLVTVTSSEGHRCGLLPSGMVCWGSNLSGQLGIGDAVATIGMLPVVGGGAFVKIAAGWVNSCALTAQGAAYCWGANDWGSVGDGTLMQRKAPAKVLDPL